MAPKMLTDEVFASLLTVGNCSVLDPPVVIPAKHSVRLIGLGYISDIAGRLRMSTPGVTPFRSLNDHDRRPLAHLAAGAC